MLVINSDSIVYAEGENDGISTYAVTSINPTASLTIGGDATDKQVITSPGNVGYRSHTVTVNASDIESYSLTISGPTNLTSGTSTTVSGAGNKTPANMPNNTWGYSWGDSDKTTAAYQTLSSTGTTLTGDKVNGFKVNFTKNLFFAAKFASNAAQGRYQANVTLSLAATPRAIATGFGGIVDMQDMTGAICASVPIGTTGSLEDIRDQSVYTVAKLSDGNCWMTQNLRLTGGRTLTSSDSNVVNDWNFPASLTTLTNTDFSSSDSGAKTYYKEDTLLTRGVYYSWSAAMAGIDDGQLIEGGMTGSSTNVCPKGWTLPTKTNYDTLLQKGNITNDEAGRATIQNAPYNFIYAGGVSGGALHYSSSAGLYWSRTAGAGRAAYRLYITSDGVTVNGASVYDGLPIRCIAEQRTLNNITVMQEMTPQICENTTAVDANKTLTDTRDWSTYTVDKLPDGRCWMTQNLRIVNRTITPAVSDTSVNFTVPASDASKFSSNTASKAYYGNNVEYGAYYSWCSATAGTCADITDANSIAPSSICPKGWTLPSRTEYIALLSLAGNDVSKLQGVPYSLNMAGYFGDVLTAAGTYGSYWSSTASSDTNAYYMYLSGTEAGTDGYRRLYGRSVRCVAR